MPIKSFRLPLLITIACLLLAGCGASKDAPAAAIEGYITALASQDVNQLVNASCADWESNARVELDSLASVSSAVEGLACQVQSQTEDEAVVTCAGKIALDYDGELQEIDLTFYNYVARLDGGEWRMCGYK